MKTTQTSQYCTGNNNNIHINDRIGFDSTDASQRAVKTRSPAAVARKDALQLIAVPVPVRTNEPSWSSKVNDVRVL